jgi:hypothetical protein
MLIQLLIFAYLFQPWEPDASVETFREALETQFTEYTANHYKHGVCAVFAQSRSDCMSLVACIEDHQFQPKNYWFVQFLKYLKYKKYIYSML